MMNKPGTILILLFLPGGVTGAISAPSQGPGERITVFYTSNLNGVLTGANCGRCEWGDLSHWAGLVNTLRKQHPSSLLVDSGGFIHGDSDWEVMLPLMAHLRYTGVGVSESDAGWKEQLLPRAQELKVPLIFTPEQEERGVFTVLAGEARGAVFNLATENGSLRPSSIHWVRESLPPKAAGKFDFAILLVQASPPQIEMLAHTFQASPIPLLLIGGWTQKGKGPRQVGKVLIPPPAPSGRGVGQVDLWISQGSLVNACFALWATHRLVRADAYVAALLAQRQPSSPVPVEEKE